MTECPGATIGDALSLLVIFGIIWGLPMVLNWLEERETFRANQRRDDDEG